MHTLTKGEAMFRIAKENIVIFNFLFRSPIPLFSLFYYQKQRSKTSCTKGLLQISVFSTIFMVISVEFLFNFTKGSLSPYNFYSKMFPTAMPDFSKPLIAKNRFQRRPHLIIHSVFNRNGER